MLRSSVGGEKEVRAEGGDVGTVLRALADEHPDLSSQLFGPDGSLNRYVNVYLNDEDVRVLEGLETPVGESRRPERAAGDGGRRVGDQFVRGTDVLAPFSARLVRTLDKAPVLRSGSGLDEGAV